ncbi:MAG: hypothetical protein AVDCRST_MAG71-1140, partial [uncultured Lysobacter sp.]
VLLRVCPQGRGQALLRAASRLSWMLGGCRAPGRRERRPAKRSVAAGGRPGLPTAEAYVGRRPAARRGGTGRLLDAGRSGPRGITVPPWRGSL